MWQQWVNFVLGIVVAAAPLLGLSMGVQSTETIAGIAIAILAIWGVLYEKSDRHKEVVEHRSHHRTA